MSRIASVLSVLCVTCLVVSVSSAEESPIATWMKYLEGNWTYEISDGTKGDVVWAFATDGQSMIGRSKEGNTTGIELGGWQPDTKIGMVNGYDSKGNYWQLEYKHFSDKGNRGPIRVKTDESEYSGDFEATIVDKDHWRWTIKGKTSEGEEVNLSATFHRVEPPAFTDEESEKWLKFFVGRWKREREMWLGDEKTVDTATWSSELAADGKATVEKGKWDQTGATWVMIAGWGSDKIHFERGTESSGIEWSIDYTKVDDRTLRGKTSGVVEGQEFEGTITLTMTGEDSYTVAWENKLANGEVGRAKVTNTRVK